MPEAVPTAVNGRKSEPPVESATPDRIPPAEQQPDPGTANSVPAPSSTAGVTPPRLDTSATLSTPQPTSTVNTDASDKHWQQLAQMIIRDKETGKEYMIADLAGESEHLSSQKLIDLSTNETRVLQYDTLEREPGSTTARSGPRSAASSQMHAHSSGPLPPGNAGTSRERPADDTASAGASGAASPTGETKTKSTRGVKGWAQKARMWHASPPCLYELRTWSPWSPLRV
jgi:hypothetical protein